MALSKRGDKGLLSGLWQLPDTDDFLNEGSAIAYLQNVGLEPLELQKIVHANHVFTHIHWDMRCYYMTVREAAGSYTWVRWRKCGETMRCLRHIANFLR